MLDVTGAEQSLASADEPKQEELLAGRAVFRNAYSTKHLRLYQKFGFWPRFLTPLLVKPVSAEPGASPAMRFSPLTPKRAGRGTCRVPRVDDWHL